MKIKISYSGMSLVEIMVAIFLLSFAILGVATVIPASMEMTQKTKTRAQAIEIASGIIDELKGKPFRVTGNNHFVKIASYDPNFSGSGVIENWTPRVWQDYTAKAGSLPPLFLRNKTGSDLRGTVMSSFSNASGLKKIAAIRILPVQAQIGLYQITVTVNIEDVKEGKPHYSFVQMVTYRGDSLISPGSL